MRFCFEKSMTYKNLRQAVSIPSEAVTGTNLAQVSPGTTPSVQDALHSHEQIVAQSCGEVLPGHYRRVYPRSELQ